MVTQSSLCACALAVAAAVASSAACASRARPPTVIPTPELRGRQLVIPSTGNKLPDLVLEATWELIGDRYCVTDEVVTLATASGAIPFDDADLCVTLDPVSIEGEATVAFPALGFLESAGVRVEGRRAELRLALGSQLETLEVDGRRIEPNPYHYYLYVHYRDGLEVGIGNASVTSPGAAGATLVIAPQEPLLYVSGAMAAPMFPVGIDDVAFGFSPAGRLGFEPGRTLREGTRRFEPAIAGHLLIAGTIPIHPYPISVWGELVVDVDANGDGHTIFAGDERDFQLGINGSIALGYQKAGFDFSFQLADGVLVYDARPGAAGAVHFAAGDSGGLFADTPLAVFEPTRSGEIHGYFRDPERFGIYAETATRVLGFQLARTTVSLDPSGIRAAGNLRLPADIGRVDVEGALNADGTFALRGRADLTVGKLKMLGATVTLGARGVSARGVVELPGVGKAEVSGAINADGTFALSGSGDLRPAGLRLANARVTVTPRGAAVSGRANFAGTGFGVSGDVGPTAFDLGGRVDLDLAVLEGHASLAIGNRGARATVHGKACLPGGACIDLAGFDVDTRGRICPIFPVVGKKCLKVL